MTDKYIIPREKTRQLEKILREQNVDALLILSREGSDDVLPFLIGDNSTHLCAAFFMKDRKHIMLTSKSDEKKYTQSSIFSEVAVYEKSLNELLTQALNRIAPKNLALNMSKNDPIADGLSYGLYLTLADIIGKERLNAIVLSSENIIRELRSVKTPGEIECLRRCIQITNDIYDEVFQKIMCGMSEKEIGELFIDGMKKRNVCNGLGKPFDYPIVCLVSAGLAHRGPGDIKSVPGDIVIMDFSVRSEGYVSDIARTAYFLKDGESEAPSEVQQAFQTAHNAITAVIEYISAGKRGWEVDATGRMVVEKAGYPTVRHSVGHPIGRQCHDSGTRLGPFKGEDDPSNRIIKVNEVYAIEPTIIQDRGLPCMLVEENVLISPMGTEILSRRQNSLYLIPPPDKREN